ncbi:hypothetical protein SAMN05216391_10942 [Lachnospiraceae bacterium KHCPX20]|nr:hypothetical protein SAMN05216391_10942 [Lachnospiraceae bacterium KHCPX20]
MIRRTTKGSEWALKQASQKQKQELSLSEFLRRNPECRPLAKLLMKCPPDAIDEVAQLLRTFTED